MGNKISLGKLVQSDTGAVISKSDVILYNKVRMIARECSAGAGTSVMDSTFIKNVENVSKKSKLLGLNYREQIWKQGMWNTQYEAGIEALGNTLGYLKESLEAIYGKEYKLYLSFDISEDEKTLRMERAFGSELYDGKLNISEEDDVYVEMNLVRVADNKCIYYSREVFNLTFNFIRNDWRFTARCEEFMSDITTIIGLEIERKRQRRENPNGAVVINEKTVERVAVLSNNVMIDCGWKGDDNAMRMHIKSLLTDAMEEEHDDDIDWVYRYLMTRDIKVGGLY